jgi:hypothetical protein
MTDGLSSCCRICINDRSREWQLAHPQRYKEIRDRWHERHKDDPEHRAKKLASWKAWAAANREHVNASKRALRAANPEREREKRARRWARIEQRLSSAMRSRIRHAFARELPTLGSDKNGRSWETIVGYTNAELKAHIERQFRGRMSWSNFGKWQIDHIVPVSSFRFQSVDDPEFRACWALTNLRPMWAGPNRSKAAKRLTLL